ncbi:hypothetical protein RIU82_09140 [Enterobacter soli]|nr:hypothetical protein [Enterobacter soli]
MEFTKQALKRLNEAPISIRLMNGCFNRAESVAEFSRHRFELIVDVTHSTLHWQCGDRNEVNLYLMKGDCGHRISMPDSLQAKVAEMQKAATMSDSEAREISMRNAELFMNGLSDMGFK